MLHALTTIGCVVTVRVRLTVWCMVLESHRTFWTHYRVCHTEGPTVCHLTGRILSASGLIACRKSGHGDL